MSDHAVKSSGENTPKVHPNLKAPWKPGESGNPEGKPKGSRNKLGEAFLEALHSDFQKHGADAIKKCREGDPTAYVRVCASILPKQLNVKHDPLDEMTDEQLREYIQRLAEQLGPVLAFTGVGEGDGEAEGATKH